LCCMFFFDIRILITPLVSSNSSCWRSLIQLRRVCLVNTYIFLSVETINIQHNGQKKKYKRTNNDLKKHTHGTKDRITRTPLKTGDELRCSGRVGSSCSISGTRRRVKLVTNVLYVLLRYTDSDYPFGIFKLFLLKILDTAQTGVLSKHIYLSISWNYWSINSWW
jgi:hypothetical protein